MTALATARLARALADLAAPALDPAVFTDYFAALLVDDASVDSILPVVASALGDDTRARAAAAALVAAFVGPPEQTSPPTAPAPEAAAPLPAFAVLVSDKDVRRMDVSAVAAAPAAAAPAPEASGAGAESRGDDAVVGGVAVECRGSAEASAPRPAASRRRVRGSVPPPAPTQPPAPPCRHFLAGECRRSDCAFSHDTRAVPCRYWDAPSGCLAGDGCAFMHAAAVGADGAPVDVRAVCGGSDDDGGGDGGGSARAFGPRAPVRTLGAAAGLDFERGVSGDGDGAFVGRGGGGGDDAGAIDWVLERLRQLEAGGEDGEWGSDGEEDEPGVDVADVAAFPALPGAAAAGTAGAAPSHMKRAAAADSAATRLALALLARAFPSLPPPTLRRSFENAGRDVRAAAAQIALAHDVAPAPGALAAPPARRRPPRAVALGQSPQRRAHEAVARRIASSLAWVSTGAAVATLYGAARRDAGALAKARNLAFHRSTQAYLAGDGAAAARFARQGRQFDDDMRGAHAAAAAHIFAERNVRGGGGGSSGTSASMRLPPPTPIDVAGTGAPSPVLVHVLDLHGLHPAEAAGAVLGAVEALAAGDAGARDGAWVAAVTGTRHHSAMLGKGGGSVRDAVLAAARGGGWEVYDPPSDDSGDLRGGGGAPARLPSGVVVVHVAGGRL